MVTTITTQNKYDIISCKKNNDSSFNKAEKITDLILHNIFGLQLHRTQQIAHTKSENKQVDKRD